MYLDSKSNSESVTWSTVPLTVSGPRGVAGLSAAQAVGWGLSSVTDTAWDLSMAGETARGSRTK